MLQHILVSVKRSSEKVFRTWEKITKLYKTDANEILTWFGTQGGAGFIAGSNKCLQLVKQNPRISLNTPTRL